MRKKEKGRCIKFAKLQKKVDGLKNKKKLSAKRRPSCSDWFLKLKASVHIEREGHCSVSHEQSNSLKESHKNATKDEHHDTKEWDEVDKFAAAAVFSPT